MDKDYTVHRATNDQGNKIYQIHYGDEKIMTMPDENGAISMAGELDKAHGDSAKTERINIISDALADARKRGANEIKQQYLIHGKREVTD